MSNFDGILDRSRRLREESRVLRDDARMTREALAVIRAEAQIREVAADLEHEPSPRRWRSIQLRAGKIPRSH